MEDEYYYIDENNVKHILELENALSIEIYKKTDIHYISYRTSYIYYNNIVEVYLDLT